MMGFSKSGISVHLPLDREVPSRQTLCPKLIAFALEFILNMDGGLGRLISASFLTVNWKLSEGVLGASAFLLD